MKISHGARYHLRAFLVDGCVGIRCFEELGRGRRNPGVQDTTKWRALPGGSVPKVPYLRCIR